MTYEDYRACDATELAARVRAGSVSATELVALAAARADAVEPRLNAIVHDSRGLAGEMAHAVDAARAAEPSAHTDRPLAGVPLLIKDQAIPVAGLPMRSGSRGYRDHVSTADGFLAAKLRAAGLCFLGKTNLSEFGFNPFTEPVSAGPTHNPWDLTRTPGGSSGGSAAAVAAGIVPLATAADGGGSIRIPASCCGLVGLKPSRGRISLAPAPPDAWNYAVAQGCVSRSVRDTAAYLDAASGPAPGEAFVVTPPAEPFAVAYAKTPPRLRIALSTTSPLDDAQVDYDCVDAAQHTASLLRTLGHTVEEVVLPYRDEHLREVFSRIILGEAAATVDEMQDELGRPLTAADLEFATRLTAAIGHVYSAAEYARAKRRWSALTREIGYFQERYDLILTPTLGKKPFAIGALQPTRAERRAGELLLRLKLARLAKSQVRKQSGRIYSWIPFTPFANMTGQPSVSLPLYWNRDGLPIGTMLTGRIHEDALLLQVARELELAQPWFARVPEL